MILAAGLGNRMQPLTAELPKPLLRVGNYSLVEHQVMKLKAAGITEIVINHYYLGELIEQRLGDGSRFGVGIRYSHETVRLETAGGIIAALPLLEDDCFLVVNADIWTDFDFSTLMPVTGSDCLAHLVLVGNADHHPTGDFCLDDSGRVHAGHGSRDPRLTFSGISVLHKKLFEGYPPAPQALLPLLQAAMAKDLVRGQYYKGTWIDIGTPERLQTVRELYASEQKQS